MCSGNETIKCALRMGLSNVPWEWDYQMCPGKELAKCAPGMGLSNVPCEWD